MFACRFLFGMGEAGAFPSPPGLCPAGCCLRNGVSQGITHAGSRLGAAMTPALVGWMIVHYGWRVALRRLGRWVLFGPSVWFWYYRDHPGRTSERECRGTRTDLSGGGRRKGPVGEVPWGTILRTRRSGAIRRLFLLWLPLATTLTGSPNI